MAYGILNLLLHFSHTDFRLLSDSIPFYKLLRRTDSKILLQLNSPSIWLLLLGFPQVLEPSFDHFFLRMIIGSEKHLY